MKMAAGAHLAQQLPHYLRADAIGRSNTGRRRVRVMRLYTHDLRSVPDVPLQSGDCIATLERSRCAVLRDVYPVDLAEDRSRLDQDHKCFVGWADGRAAHFSWVQDSGVHEIGGTWRRDAIQPGDFWIYSCRTADWARGRRLYPATLVTILRMYKNLNYQRALIYVAEENEASISGIERAGFVLAERIRSVAIRASLFPLPVLPASESDFTVVRVAGKQALAPYLPLVDDLATRALERNLFYEPWMLSSAPDAAVASSGLVFLLVFKTGLSTSGPRLCGFFPMTRPRRRHGLMVRSYRLLGHMYSFLGVPLVDADTAPSVLEHFLSACRTSRVSVVEFPMIPSGGEFHRVLIDVLHRLWLDTRIIEHIVVSPGSPWGDLAVGLVPILRWIKRRLRRTSAKETTNRGASE